MRSSDNHSSLSLNGRRSRSPARDAASISGMADKQERPAWTRVCPGEIIEEDWQLAKAQNPGTRWAIVWDPDSGEILAVRVSSSSAGRAGRFIPVGTALPGPDDREPFVPDLIRGVHDSGGDIASLVSVIQATIEARVRCWLAIAETDEAETEECLTTAGVAGCRARRPVVPIVGDESRILARQFGANVRVARTGARLSQEAAAERAGLHRTGMSMIERGVRLPRIDTLVKLALALGVLPGSLLNPKAHRGRRRMIPMTSATTRGLAANFGANVAQRRRAKGLNQTELGVLVGMHRNDVSLVERGKRRTRINYLLNLAHALEVDPEDLLFGG